MSRNKGKEGEQYFQQIMIEKGYQVMDVSDNPNYWYRDIDFIITSPTTGDTKTFEVKWDFHINRTKNLFLETDSRNSKEFKGWWQFCEADYLVYGDARARKFYVIDMQQLRQRVEQLPIRWGYCGTDSRGILVNIDQIRDILTTL